jgi:hypothetical protein
VHPQVLLLIDEFVLPTPLQQFGLLDGLHLSLLRIRVLGEPDKSRGRFELSAHVLPHRDWVVDPQTQCHEVQLMLLESVYD